LDSLAMIAVSDVARARHYQRPEWR